MDEMLGATASSDPPLGAGRRLRRWEAVMLGGLDNGRAGDEARWRA